MQASEEVVEIYRQLAIHRHTAFNSYPATFLTNFSNYLFDLGRRQEGLRAIAEAVELQRRLSADLPFPFNHGLAMSLNNLSVRLSTPKRPEEALHATEDHN